MRMMKWSMTALVLSAGTSQFAIASSQDDSKGFFESQSLKSKTRLEYMNRDYKNGAGNISKPGGGYKSGYRQDTGISVLLTYESGFTQGTVGVGVDAMAMGAARLDGGAGRASNGLFAVNGDGMFGQPEKTQSETGAAIKFRISDTTLKYGHQFVASPVFATDDSRLLPEVAEGTLITSKEIKDLELNAGRFTALSKDSIGGAAEENGNGAKGLSSTNIFGATYAFTDNFSGTLAASKVDQYFKKQYVNLNYTLQIAESQYLNFDFNGYKTEGDKRGDLVDMIGDGRKGVDNKLWSLAVAYSLGAHIFTLAHQRSSGDNGYYYGVDGYGTLFVANTIQISDFVGRDERSWQARYDLNMATYGVPGLSFMASYVTGDNISTNGLGEGKEKEFNFETKYVLQEGPAKDLSFRLRSAVYRVNSAYSGYLSDSNDVRITVEYPLSIL